MKNLEQETKENDTLDQAEQKPFNRKSTIYMICVLIFLVILAVVSSIIDKKMNRSDENIAEEEMMPENVSLTVYGELSQEELLEHIREAIVQIEVKIPDISNGETTMIGSGVIIEITDEYIDIATAKHVVEQTAKPLIYFYDGSLAYGSVLAYGKTSDIAFVRVESESLAEGIGDGISAAKWADNEQYDALKADESVFMLGSVSRVAGNVEQGILVEKEQFVELFQNHMLICEGSVSGGMSGGGTFSSEGYWIGIIVGTNGSQSVSVAIPDVMAEYRSI